MAKTARSLRGGLAKTSGGLRGGLAEAGDGLRHIRAVVDRLEAAARAKPPARRSLQDEIMAEALADAREVLLDPPPVVLAVCKLVETQTAALAANPRRIKALAVARGLAVPADSPADDRACLEMIERLMTERVMKAPVASRPPL